MSADEVEDSRREGVRQYDRVHAVGQQASRTRRRRTLSQPSFFTFPFPFHTLTPLTRPAI